MTLLATILQRLGYIDSQGWVAADEFDRVTGPVGALRRARSTMGVQGAFGTWQVATSPRGRRFVPLLYVASAPDAEAARTLVHRRVWSQGLVPLLIICTPEHVFISEGYGFSHDNWERSVTRIDASLLESDSDALVTSVLDRFSARRLLSSIAWRDYAINPGDRVDQRLLSTLEALSKRLSRQSGASARSANALIGRFLYFYILHDRSLVDERWLGQFQAQTAFTDRGGGLSASLVWRVFDALDELLNGTIFPLSESERAQFSDTDVQLLRDCIKLGDELKEGSVQLRFLDFDLSSLQTETLSAIYEQFLESEDPSSKRQDGVFYTPPYLADFVLDRVEDVIGIVAGKRVIDCTAGSGVFVVGAYRRMIEASLQESGLNILPAAQLRDILLRSIFAIEKNPSAHAVTAFSLYLTMLDYVDPTDIRSCLYGEAAQPLFPPLNKANILCGDFFAIDPPASEDARYDIALGNPPWQSLEDVTSSQELTTEAGMKVDGEEAAEHAVWLVLDKYLRKDGIAAQVVPTKSLVSPSAKRFPLHLANTMDVIGVVNLTHLRYVLFAHARQAASVLLVRNKAPTASSQTWVFSPTRAHLPGPVESSGPWMIGYDASQVQHFQQRLLAEGGERWFEAIMLRPVDRHIRQYMSDRVGLGHVLSLGDFLKAHGMEIKKGGSPAQTGLKSEDICGADKFKGNDFRKRDGVESIAINVQGELVRGDRPVGLACDWEHRAHNEFHRRFSGNVLLIPRSMRDLAYASAPLAFNSSVNAVFFSALPLTDSERQAHRRVLMGLGRYLESGLARYLIAITGRLWMLDRTRLEKNDLLDIPVPFQDLDDPLIDMVLDEDAWVASAHLMERFGLSGALADAVNEYGLFRNGFEDGQVPTSFSRRPTEEDLLAYKKALEAALRPVSDGQPEVRVVEQEDRLSPYRVAISLSAGTKAGDPLSGSADIADLSRSMQLRYNPSQTFLEIRKPAEKFRWTVESAYTDGATIIQALMEDAA